MEVVLLKTWSGGCVSGLTDAMMMGFKNNKAVLEDVQTVLNVMLNKPCSSHSYELSRFFSIFASTASYFIFYANE